MPTIRVTTTFTVRSPFGDPDDVTLEPSTGEAENVDAAADAMASAIRNLLVSAVWLSLGLGGGIQQIIRASDVLGVEVQAEEVEA